MRLKKYITPVLFLLMYVQGAYGQQSNILNSSYIRVEGKGLLTSQIKEATKEKLVKIYTVGGFVTINSTNTFDKLANKLYLNTYLKERPHKQSKNILPSEVYLNPNEEFYVDILDGKTDSLVCRYEIKRLRSIPKIKLYTTNESGIRSLVLPSDDHSSEFKLSPGEKIKLVIDREADFRDLQVEYTLVNLKTKRTEHKIIQSKLESLKLVANTDYELRVNYVVQKENVGVGYLRVKPYWYQSITTYIIALLVFVAIVILLITRSLKNKVKSSLKEQQKMEQAAIRLQSLLNPHFTFNALSSIQGLMNTNRIDEANQYLQEFSSLLRKTLAKSKHIFNSLDQELEMMRMYIRIEAFRFNFSWDIEIAEELNPSVIEIPTLLLQPLIENSIKHGLSGLGEKGQLLIVCKEGQKKGTFVIVVKDNGTWLNKSSEFGYGLSLTEERIKTINSMKKEQNIVLDFNKKDGTEAILTFHNWLDN
ncbi:hypothetical protein FA048_06695 [Pedobacter polaris]|uniref:Signal transduction histidine kinase internal region domain-containing protein n=1 Tax=Pedobacter polaris TaxID=2571273 RepID=A0A4U1CPB9_9SPHI|nr:histidine kinase [Pedobacter polaris]TKC09897.1 hypothetical protein FA048_06695 [Pedobacter polaris]